MAASSLHRLSKLRKICLRDINPYITCSLCNGYLIEATTLVDCMHVFCRACILRYFENSKMGCPTCNTVYKKKNSPCFRPDPIMQSLVYKLVPGLYSREVQRRDDFYRSTGMRASSSCSEDSVLGDLTQEHEEWISSNVEDQNQYFSPDDSISLSLEYYQPHLDVTDKDSYKAVHSTNDSIDLSDKDAKIGANPNEENSKKPCATTAVKIGVKSGDSVSGESTDDEQKCTKVNTSSVSEKDKVKVESGEGEKRKDRRYLQCPSAVSMSLLQKFLRMKYALSLEHKVDIIYNGEVLPQYFTLMDVAYTFKWQRLKPMRFFYRIFTPVKIQPIKIVKTTSSNGKQLQIVPVKQSSETPAPSEEKSKEKCEKDLKSEAEAEAQNNINKENLLAHLNLKSKVKLEQEQNQQSSSKTVSIKFDNKPAYQEDCVKNEKPKRSYDFDKELKKYDSDDIDEKLSKLYESHKEAKSLERKCDDTAKLYQNKSPRQGESKSPKHGDKSPKYCESKSPKYCESKSPKYTESKSPKHSEGKSPKDSKSPRYGDNPYHYYKDQKINSSFEYRESKSPEENCVYEYEERDEDELRRFAEKRDREWALQKQMDEEEEKYRVSKKRKKSKHSKSDFLHKKRKLHAEITSNESLNKEESLKLKVKITPHNGHKHKHHKSYQNHVVEPVSPKQPELSSKEKLLQMRQVRHKSISTDKDKKTQSSPQKDQETSTSESTISSQDKSTQSDPKPGDNGYRTSESADKHFIKKPENDKPSQTNKPLSDVNTSASTKTETKTTSYVKTVESSSTQTINKVKEITPKTTEQGTAPKSEPIVTGKNLRSDFSIKSSDMCNRYPTVQLERHEQAERQIQKTYLKTFQSYTEKLAESVAQNKAESSKMITDKKTSSTNTFQNRNQSSSSQIVKTLERKFANLHQQYGAESKLKVVQSALSNKNDKKVPVSEKSQNILNTPYSTGFTVSKIEAGTKRKLETTDEQQDKRPSLEITLINPPTTTSSPSQMQKSKAVATEIRTGIKRPPPPTIPLERIKKSINLKSGISIIPKLPDRCDSSVPLDLSNPCKNTEIFPNRSNGITVTTGNGATKVQPSSSSPKTSSQERVQTPDKNIQLSNLQMLSKVALEHSSINKSPIPTLVNIAKKPQMPSLQSIKVPMPHQNSVANKTPNLAKLPKLNEINKSTFRMMNPQMRNMRPNQNQNIRNIPNPSLLVRQQNQNRLNSMNSAQNNATESGENSTKNQINTGSEKSDKAKEDNSERKPTTEANNTEERSKNGEKQVSS